MRSAAGAAAAGTTAAPADQQAGTAAKRAGITATPADQQAGTAAKQAGITSGQAGTAIGQAQSRYRGAFEPLRPAGASPRARAWQGTSGQALHTQPPAAAARAAPPAPAVQTEPPGPALPAQPPTVAARARPSWPAVLAATARLWLARNVYGAGGRLRPACLTILVLAVATAAGVVVTRQGLVGTPQAGEATPRWAAVRGLAAGWVARQVGSNITLACDPAMCTELVARGFPAANLMPIAPGRAVLPSADLVVATQAVRGYFGSRLAQVYAPLVIASFGAGPAQVQIRQMAPAGVAAFERQWGKGRVALRWAAAELLKNPRIKVSAAARAALMAGRVDGRLLTVLAALAARQPVRVLGFTSANPGAAPGVPMRVMLLAGSDPAANLPALAYRRSVASFLNAQQPLYHPARWSLVRRFRGPDAIAVSFAAPSPPGL